MTPIEVLAQEAGEPGAALPHLAEIIVGFVAFAILVYILGRYVWPQFLSSHDDDVQRLRSGMERAETENQRAQDDLARKRERLAGVDAESSRIRDDARADAERITSDTRARTEEESERIVGQGRQTLDASRSRTVSDLRSDVGSRSVELARRLVESSLADESARSASVDGFLDRLESMASDSGAPSNGSRTAPGAQEARR